MQPHPTVPARKGSGTGRQSAGQPPRRPARDLVHDCVRHGILHGSLAAGTFLEEEQVSAAVGVSRTPAREAFHKALVEAAGNRVTAMPCRSIAFQQERVAMASVSISPCRRRIMLAEHEHEQLAAALAVHDEAAAVATLARHLRPIQDILACLPERQ